MHELTHEWLNGRINECMHEWIDEWISRRVDERFKWIIIIIDRRSID